MAQWLVLSPHIKKDLGNFHCLYVLLVSVFPAGAPVSSHSLKTCRLHVLETLNCPQASIGMLVCLYVLALWQTSSLSRLFPKWQ